MNQQTLFQFPLHIVGGIKSLLNYAVDVVTLNNNYRAKSGSGGGIGDVFGQGGPIPISLG